MERERHQGENRGRVLRFEPRGAAWRAVKNPSVTPGTGASPVDDVDKYERTGGEPDDYRHRQLMNAAAFLVCALLVVMGVWIAIKIADLRRDQDCVLSGRRNCAQISITGNSAR